jgi:transposase
MSSAEWIRLDAMQRVKRKMLSLVAAAELLGISVRQGRRIWKRFKVEGGKGLVHQLRGRRSNHRLSEEIRERVVKRHQETYADFGPTLACEKLAEEELKLSPDTLTALLKERGLWQRRRRRGKHRKRRERRTSFGSMLQMDGSHHDWFEGRGPWCVLMVIIDDATSQTWARFYPAETTEAAFDLFGRWITDHGLPRSLYVDRHSIYRNNDKKPKPESELPRAKPAPTQFGRAMKQLDVELICANSPQAKGRVERRNAVFQDRLVKEMRLRKINTLQQANALLETMFLKEMNHRLAIKPADEQDLHRLAAPGVVLAEVLCVQEQRVVGQDWCVRWNNRWLQISSAHAGLRLPRRTVLVHQLSDGQLLMDYQGQRLTFTELSAQPQVAKPRKPIVNNRTWKPPASHPWKGERAVSSRPCASLAPATPARGLHTEKKKAG